ncbi:hypothetical protein [Pseudomonas mohnii]|jgi:hypothetical protein
MGFKISEDFRSRLTGREREIAIEAIGRRLSGSPAESAKDMLVGISVLDGKHAPFVVWSEEYGFDYEERAAWLEAQAASARASATRYAEVISQAQHSVERSPETHLEKTLSPSQGQPLSQSASSTSLHPEAGKESPLPQLLAEPAQGSSDAC